MRDRLYWLAALLAWPAAVWCAAELSLRGISGYSQGWLDVSVTFACATGTIVAVRLRRQALVQLPARP